MLCVLPLAVFMKRGKETTSGGTEPENTTIKKLGWR
jgi:hypothetical protein